MAYFQAKMWWDRLRMRENKITISIHSNPTRNTEFQRMSKKIQKTRKLHYGFFSSQNGTWSAESDKKKKDIVPIHSNLTQNWEFLKNSREMQKIKKHHYGFISRQNVTGYVVCDTKKKKVIVQIHSNKIWIKNSKK